MITTKWSTSKVPLVYYPEKGRNYLRLSTSSYKLEDFNNEELIDREILKVVSNFAPKDAKSYDIVKYSPEKYGMGWEMNYEAYFYTTKKEGYHKL